MIALLQWMLVLLIALTSLIPLVVFLRNWKRYLPPPCLPEQPALPLPRVSVLIPARDESDKIEQTLIQVLANQQVELELLVLDDNSTDDTAAIVQRIAAIDTRVRLIHGPPLPAGWNGKQHACHLLSQHASYPVLVFLDADVRLSPDALCRGGAFLQSSGASLVSGIPHQETRSWLEMLVIPLIHFLLLAYLPIDRMRNSRSPAYGAGCGQLFIADRVAYERAGGHAALRASRHDGIMLPRAFRRAGFATDLFDAERIARCRMYQTAGQVWNGLRKNSIEGIGSPAAIVPWTIVLFAGQVLPWLLVIGCIVARVPLHAEVTSPLWLVSLLAVCAILAINMRCVARFHQTGLNLLLHPVAVMLLLLIQWNGLLRHLLGRPTAWKGRSQNSTALSA